MAKSKKKVKKDEKVVSNDNVAQFGYNHQLYESLLKNNENLSPESYTQIASQTAKSDVNSKTFLSDVDATSEFYTNVSDILLDDELKQQNESQTQNAPEAKSDELEAGGEVKKFEQELLDTKKQLQTYTSKFSDEYLEKIRKTDYYKERFAYWKDYYSKRRQEAEEKDQQDNLARSEALAEIEADETKKQLANKEVLSDKDKNNINNISKADWFVDKIDTVIDNLYAKDAEVQNKEAENKDVENKDVENNKNVEVKDVESENAKNKDAKLADENVNADENIAKTVAQGNLELANKVNKYVSAVLLDSLHDSLKGERDSLRKISTKLSAEEKKSSKNLAKIFDEKYNIYNDAVASFDNVINKKGNENKKEAGQRQKNAQNFSANPQLKTANNILIDNLRKTYIENISQYMTNIIVGQIESQNLQDSVLITKSSIKDAVNQIINNSNAELEKIVKKLSKAEEKKISNLQQSIDESKELLNNKDLSKEEKEEIKSQLQEKQSAILYEKFASKYLDSKYSKQLKKPSANFVMDMALEKELSKIYDLKSKDRLNEYVIDENEAKDMSNKIIKLLGKNNEIQLNLKVKDNSKQKEEKLQAQPVSIVEEKQEIVEPKQEQQPQEVKEVKEEIPLEVSDPMEAKRRREMFVEERSDVLMGMIGFTKRGLEYAEATNNKKAAKFFDSHLEFARIERTFWECQVLGARTKINMAMDFDTDISYSDIQFYNEDFNLPFHEFYKYNSANVVKKMKEIGTIEDEKPYLEMLKIFDNLMYDIPYVQKIKDESLRDTIMILSCFVPEYDAYILCSKLSKKWKNAIKSQLEQKPSKDLPYILPREVVNEADLKLIDEALDRNEEYYQWKFHSRAGFIKKNLEYLQQYKDELLKYEKEILKEREKCFSLSK